MSEKIYKCSHSGCDYFTTALDEESAKTPTLFVDSFANEFTAHCLSHKNPQRVYISLDSWLTAQKEHLEAQAQKLSPAEAKVRNLQERFGFDKNLSCEDCGRHHGQGIYFGGDNSRIVVVHWATSYRLPTILNLGGKINGICNDCLNKSFRTGLVRVEKAKADIEQYRQKLIARQKFAKRSA